MNRENCLREKITRNKNKWGDLYAIKAQLEKWSGDVGSGHVAKSLIELDAALNEISMDSSRALRELDYLAPGGRK